MAANRLAFGAVVEPIEMQRWRLVGPFGEVDIKLNDGGGWDTTHNISPAGATPEHVDTLHRALLRAYNLAMGHSKP